MLRLMCFLALFIPVAAFSNAIKIKDGLYYGYWVYKDRGVLKEYGVLADNPKKENGEYILTPTPKYTADDEVYMQVKGSKSVVYYYHANAVSDFNTIGWADVKINSNNISIGKNTIRMVTEDTKDRVVVGDKFSGKIVRLERDEIVPFKVINDDIFEVDCNQYLKAIGRMVSLLMMSQTHKGRRGSRLLIQLQFLYMTSSVYVLHFSMMMLSRKLKRDGFSFVGLINFCAVLGDNYIAYRKMLISCR